MRYESLHTYMIDFARIDRQKMSEEIVLFNGAWPSISVFVGLDCISLAHSNNNMVYDASVMLLNNLRKKEWFHE